MTFAPTSFACGTHQDARVAYMAAFVLARYSIETSVATPLNAGELDEEVWNTPVGTYRCIIVGCYRIEPKDIARKLDRH